MSPRNERTTRDVLDDHLTRRLAGDFQGDLAQNYSPDVIALTSQGAHKGHAGLRKLHDALLRHVPDGYEIVSQAVEGRFAYIEWRAREPGKSVEDGADSFVIEDGRIVFQSIHYSIQETMPL